MKTVSMSEYDLSWVGCTGEIIIIREITSILASYNKFPSLLHDIVMIFSC